MSLEGRGAQYPDFGTSPSLALSCQNFTRPRPVSASSSMRPSTMWGITKSGEMGNQETTCPAHILQGPLWLERAEFPRTSPCPTGLGPQKDKM